MSGLVKDGFGDPLRFGVSEDVLGQTPILSFIKPDGTLIQKTTADGVTIGTEDFSDDGITLLAGQYLLYVSESGLVDAEGTWQWRAEAVDSSPSRHRKTCYQILAVCL